MGVSMVPTTSLTRPVHGRLAPCAGSAHLVLADGDGVAAVVDLLDRAGDDFVCRASVLLVADAADARLARFPLAASVVVATLDEGLAGLAERLGRADMGTRLHLAGSDTLIGLARQAARAAGLADEAVSTELAGDAARRVQCIHCKTIVEGVTTATIECPGCGLVLGVRDHYSRRLAAYQAVWVGPEAARAVAAAEEAMP